MHQYLSEDVDPIQGLHTPNVDEQGPYKGLSGLLMKYVYKNDDKVDQSAFLFLSLFP